jgi:F0F1-type ATP synthase assembly protein I
LAADDPGPKPSPSDQRNSPPLARQLSEVLDLPFVLVGSIVIAAGAGYLADRWLRTYPALTLILGFLGFAGGIIQVLRRLTGKRK